MHTILAVSATGARFVLVRQLYRPLLAMAILAWE
jgi:hypothetical protein